MENRFVLSYFFYLDCAKRFYSNGLTIRIDKLDLIPLLVTVDHRYRTNITPN